MKLVKFFFDDILIDQRIQLHDESARLTFKRIVPFCSIKPIKRRAHINTEQPIVSRVLG